MAPPADSALSFLLRTLRQEGVDLDQHMTTGKWADALSVAYLWMEEHKARPPIPKTLEAIVRADSVGMPATARAINCPLANSKRRMSARTWYLTMARERIMAQRVFEESE